MKVTIQGDEILSEQDLHNVLARQLRFGPYYGRNLDGLRDRLSTDVQRPVEIIWRIASASRSHLGDELYAKIVNLLRSVEASDQRAGYSDRLCVEIEE